MLDLTEVFASFPALTTARLGLRALTPADAARVFTIMSDERVTRYFGMLPMSTPAEAERRVQQQIDDFAAGAGVRWALVRRDSGLMVGSGGFWRIMPDHHRAEIGYELAADQWGQGLMPEALAAMLTFGFTRMGLHSVEAQIHPANSGSRRVLEKLGFQQEGLLRQNYLDPAEGGFTDTAIFGLLRSEWRG